MSILSPTNDDEIMDILKNTDLKLSMQDYISIQLFKENEEAASN